jgi:serine/threonine-protein kinase
VNAPAVEPTDFRIDLSQSNAKAAQLSSPGMPAPVPSAPMPAPMPSAPPPAPRDATAVTGPPKPMLEVMPDLGQVQIRSSPALSIPQEAPPPKRGAWIAVLAIGVLFLGIGGTLVGVKLMSQRPGEVLTDATPPQPAPKAPEPVAVAPAPEPKPAVVAEAPKAPEPEPAPAPVVEAKKEEPEAAAPPTAPNKKGGKKEPHVAKASAPSKKETRPEPKPEPKPVVVAEAPKQPEPAPEPKKVEIVKTAEMGTIAFRIRPYATVLVDGKYLGDTPVSPITVPVGNVTVTLINKDLGKELKVPFEVKAGQNTFKYNLEE